MGMLQSQSWLFLPPISSLGIEIPSQEWEIPKSHGIRLLPLFGAALPGLVPVPKSQNSQTQPGRNHPIPSPISVSLVCLNPIKNLKKPKTPTPNLIEMGRDHWGKVWGILSLPCSVLSLKMWEILLELGIPAGIGVGDSDGIGV